MSTIFRNARVRVSTSTGEDDARDVSASVTKVTASRDFDLVDLTTLTKTSRFSIKGHESWMFDVGLLQAFSTESGFESGERIDSLLDTLASITAAGNSFRVAVMPNRSLPRSETNPEYSGLCVLEEYDPLNGEVGDLLKVEPSFVGVGELTRDTSTEDDAAMDDTVSISISESSPSFVNELSVSDIINLMHTDVAAIVGSTIPKTTSDTLAAQIDELTVLAMTFPITGDTISTALSESVLVSSAAITSVSSSDALKVQAATEAAAIAVTIASSDTLSVQMAEVGDSNVYSDIAHVQSTSVGTGGASSRNLAFVSDVTAGSLIVVAISSSHSISSVTDSRGNTYTEAVPYNAHNIAIWYAQNAFAGATTVTVNYSGSTSYDSVAIHEYSGVATSGALDTTASFSSFGSISAGTDSFTTSNITPVLRRSLLFGFAQIAYPLATAPGTGFTQRQEPFVNTMTQDAIQIEPVSTAASFSHSGGTSTDTCGLLCVFKPKIA